MANKSKYRWAILILVIILCLFSVLITKTNDSKNKSDNKITAVKQKDEFNKNKYSISSPDSLWVIVNKQRQLDPKDYEPSDLVVPDVPLRGPKDKEEMKLRKPTANALEELVQAASEEEIDLMLASGYRSYSLQTLVYNNYVRTQGRATADTQSARPGFSEHQTGLALDIVGTNRVCEIEPCFADTKESKWVAKNAYKYGFIIRYAKDQQKTVGYIYEPWHLRYVGKELSNQVHKLGDPTLEDFFNLGKAGNY